MTKAEHHKIFAEFVREEGGDEFPESKLDYMWDAIRDTEAALCPPEIFKETLKRALVVESEANELN